MAGMIIKPIKDILKKVFIPETELVESKKEPDESYVGVPAPVIAPKDEWFEDAPMTEKQMTHEQMLEEAEQREEENRTESKNIHQEMYELATKNWTTVKETEGWQSGTGYNQFRG